MKTFRNQSIMSIFNKKLIIYRSNHIYIWYVFQWHIIHTYLSSLNISGIQTCPRKDCFSCSRRWLMCFLLDHQAESNSFFLKDFCLSHFSLASYQQLLVFSLEFRGIMVDESCRNPFKPQIEISFPISDEKCECEWQ